MEGNMRHIVSYPDRGPNYGARASYRARVRVSSCVRDKRHKDEGSAEKRKAIELDLAQTDRPAKVLKQGI